MTDGWPMKLDVGTGLDDSPTKTQSEAVAGPSRQAMKSPGAQTRRAQEAATPQNSVAQKASAAFQSLRQLHTLYKASRAFQPQGAGANGLVQAASTAMELLVR